VTINDTKARIGRENDDFWHLLGTIRGRACKILRFFRRFVRFRLPGVEDVLLASVAGRGCLLRA
jgi:hypothetical protein